MTLIRTAANSDLRPLKWRSYFLLHFSSIVQLLNSIPWPNGSLCFDKIGVDAKKAFLLWTPQPPVAACLMSAAELPSLNQKMFRRKKEEEEEKEEESRGISKAFSFVKVGRHTYLGNVGMSRLGWRHGLMEEVK
ncbi:hypothetical protein ACFX2B_027858 [Malus domestica]